MPPKIEDLLKPELGYIFRITHRDNVPWILKNGLVCASHEQKDPGFVAIGDPELIELRASWQVPIPPGGTLADYVPFYFTPFSVMALKIFTGNGVPRRSRDEIAILISSIPRLAELSTGFIFTDSHAKFHGARYFSDPAELDEIDFALLRRRDFKRSKEDPGKVERYQAEALIHHRVSTDRLLAIACYTEKTQQDLLVIAQRAGSPVRMVHRPGWYF